MEKLFLFQSFWNKAFRTLLVLKLCIAILLATAFRAAANTGSYGAIPPVSYAAIPPVTHAAIPPITIKGKVLNSKGEPMEGVSVTTKGGNGTTTNDKGEYTLNTADDDVLTFSFLGYTKQTVNVGRRSEIDITLVEGAVTAGDEVVVIGYGTQKKKNITAAISSVTAKDLEDVHTGSTISAGLAGKVPGVSFLMQDSRPGATANIQIRNMGNPIYIIDGIKQTVASKTGDFPIPSSPFNNISMNDIESITFLKDASAAIYGVEAANGVVLITTKRGKSGMPSVGINVNNGYQSWARFPKMANNYQWWEGRAEAYVNQGQDPAAFGLSRDELAKYKAATTSAAADTGKYRSFDWYKFIVHPNAPQYNQSINFTGGTDKINFYSSLSHLKQYGVLGREFTYERTNMQSNIEAKIANGLKIGTQINGNVEIRHNPGVPNADDYQNALTGLYTLKPWERPFANDNPKYLNDLGNDNSINFGFLSFNNSGDYKATTSSIQMNYNVDWQTPVKGFSLRGVYSYYFSTYLIDNQENIYNVYSYDPATQTYAQHVGSANPWRQRDQDRLSKTTTQLQADYSRNFGKHALHATVVNERISSSELFTFVHSVPPTPLLNYITFSAMDTYTDNLIPISTIGYVGSVSYNYDERYYLQGMGRRDASYVLSPNRRWGNFSTVTGGWRISKEGFFKRLVDPKIISNLKINGSYGTTGDDRPIIALNSSDINNQFNYLNSYNYNTGVAILNGAATSISSYRGVPVTNLTWVTAKTLNIGIDFSLLNDKLTGSFEYFSKKSVNIPDNRNSTVLPSELGYNLPYQNQDSSLVRGIEATLAFQTTVHNDVRISISGNIAYARPRKLGILNPTFNNSLDNYYNNTYNRYSVPNSAGGVNPLTWGYTAIGQFQSQQQINGYRVNQDGQGNRTLLPGDIMYKDINGDGIIDQKDQRPIGWGLNSSPLLYGGMSLSAAYKGVEFRIDFSGGTDFSFSRNALLRVPFNGQGALLDVFNDRWHHQDIYDPNSPWIPGKYPSLTYNASSNNNKYSTFWNTNVYYIKCRNIEVGYNIPKNWLSTVHIRSLRAYVNVSNLFSIDNVGKYGQDPEAQIAGTSYVTYPANRVINVGATISL